MGRIRAAIRARIVAANGAPSKQGPFSRSFGRRWRQRASKTPVFDGLWRRMRGVVIPKALTPTLSRENGRGGLPHQHVAELPGIGLVDVLREQAGTIGQRGPVGVDADYGAEIGHLHFEAAPVVHLVGLDDAG